MRRSTLQNRVALAVLAAVAAAGCRDPAAEAPRPLAVTPDRGLVSQAVSIAIRGENFHAKVTTDFTQPGESALDARFTALLGPVPLLDVKLQADGSLSATVPAGLPTGAHDLTVIDPEGRKGVLPAAYRVLADTDTSQLVASFRVDPIGPQQAYAPFTVTVTAVDAMGAVVSTFNGSVLLTDLSGTAVPGSIGLFRNGVWTGSVEVRASHAADVLTAGDGQGHTGTSVPFAVAPSPAAALQFATPARTSVAGQCSGAGQPVVIALLDTFGQPTQAAQDVALSFGAIPPSGFQVFADAQCATPLAAPVVPAGAMSTTVWFRSTQAGAVSLSATAASLLPSAQGETVLAGPPAGLAFVSTPQTVNAGGCSQPAVVEVWDAWGNPTPPGAASIDLSVAPASGVIFFSDSSCTAAVASVTVAPAGGTQAQFWFQGTTAQPVTIAASAVSLGVPAATQDELILPQGSASRLVFLTPPRTAAAGSCSDLVTIQAQDSFGNAVAGTGAAQVSLSAAPGAGFAFYSDPSCGVLIAGGDTQIGSGQSTTGVYFRGTVTGTVQIAAHSTTLTDAFQAGIVLPAAPSQLAFATGAQNLPAGACSGQAALALLDTYGNVAVAGVPVAIALGAAPAAGFTFYSDASCTAQVSGITVATGGSGAAVYFKGTGVGTVTVSASASGLMGASQDEQIHAATPDHLAYTTVPQTVPAGGCSGAATLVARDAFGNPAPVPAPTPVALSALPSAGFGFFGDAACSTSIGSVTIAAGSTTASFFFRGTAPGSVSVTASAAGLASAVQAETITPAPADHLAFTTAPQSMQAGACSALATIQTQDLYGNASPVAASTTVNLSAAPAAGFGIYSDSGCNAAVTSVSIAPGASAAGFWFKGMVPGTIAVTASAAGLVAAAQTETVTPAPADHLAFTTSPQTRQAGACSAQTTIQAQDPYGNPSPLATATTVDLSAAPAAGFAIYSDSGCSSAVTSVSIAAGASGASFWFKGTAPGSIAVTASAAGLTGATQTETVTPAVPDHLSFTTASQMKQAGECSAQATIQAQDPYSNPSALAAATTVNLSAAPAAGFGFYSDASCTTSIGSVSITAGASTASFWFRGTAPGSVVVTAAAAGLTAAAQTETVTPAPADHLTFTTAPQTKPAGACSAQATVQAQDPYGNPSAVAAATTVTLAASPAAGFAFYSDQYCTVSIGSVSIAAGTSTAGFYFAASAPGSVSVTAAAAGLAGATQVETFVPAVPDHLVFTTGPQTVAAGACSARVTVQSRDTYDNVSPVAAATTVSLSAAPSTGFAFYSDAGCTAAIVSVSIAAGGSTAGFWFKGTAPGSVAVTASAAGLTAAAQADTVTPAPADHLAFTTAPQTKQAGACSAQATVQAQDPYGNASAVAAATTVTLAASPAAGFGFYSDQYCSVSIGSVSIAAGASTAGFWFKGTAPASVAVTAAAAGLTPAAQTETVTSAPPDHLAFTTAPQTRQAGACSAAVSIQSQDAYGNASAVGAATTVSLSAAPAAGFAFYSDASCTAAVGSVSIAAGGSAASFYFRGTAAASVTVTAAAAGLSPSPTQMETVNPAPSDRVVYTTTPQSATSGQCSSPVTLQSRDPYGNPSVVAAATAVTLTASPAAGFAFYAGSGCAGAPVGAITLAAGTSTTTFSFIGTTGGSPTAVTVTAAPTGLTAAAQSETINPAGTPTQLVFTTPPRTASAGACSGQLTVEAQDSLGVARPVAVATPVNLSAAPAAGFTFYSNATCTAAVTSVSIAADATTASLWFKGTVAGSVAVTAAAAGLSSAAQTETVSAASPSVLVFTTAPQARQAGQCSAVATVQTQDPYSNVSPVAGATTVSLSSAPAGLGFYSDAGCTVAVGSVSIAAGASSANFWFKGTAVGSPLVTAAAAGLASATQTETINPSGASVLVFATGPQTRLAGQCSAAATVQSQDTYGNVSPVGAATTVNLSAAPAAGFAFYSDAGCTTTVTSTSIAAGASTAGFWFKGTVPGSVAVTASATGFTPATQVETVNPGAADHLAFTTAPQTRQAGACSAVATVQTQDAFNNPFPVAAATPVTLSSAPAGLGFYSDAGCTVPTGPVSIAAGTSTANFWFKGTSVGSPVVTAAAAGLTSATQSETINPASANVLVFATAVQTRQAGQCSAVATIQSQDSYGNVSPVGAATLVNLSAAPAAGFAFYSDAGCTTAVGSVSIAGGTSTAGFWFKGTAPGSVAVTASTAGFTPASQTETITPAAPNHLAFTTGAQTRQAGQCSAVATVQLQDPYNNASTVATATTVNLSSSAPGLVFYSESTCTTTTPSVTIAAGTSAASFWFKGTSVGSPVVTAAAAGLTSVTQSETINPAGASVLVFVTGPQTRQAGACSAVVTIQSQDSYGNVSPVGSATTVTLSALPSTGFTFYSDSTCTTATISVTITAGMSAGSFWFKGTAAGSVTVTAAAAGMSPNPTQVETVSAAAPDRLAFLTAAQTRQAGACSAVATLQSRDPYGNAAPVGVATSASLTAAPATGFAFYSDAGCTTAVTAAAFTAGSSTAGFYFKGTAAGSVAVTASVAGWTASAAQTETVTPGTTDHFGWAPIPSPQGQGVAFGVTVSALDVNGNVTTAFAGTATLSIAPVRPLTCASGCTAGLVTGAFAAGVWTGSVSVGGGVTGARLTATSGAVAGTSAAFDVQGASNPSPPIARFTASPVVIRAGQTVSFDASASSDYQDPTSLLQVSWDFLGTSTGTPAPPPATPAAPWTTPWTTTKTRTYPYAAAGTYVVRLAVVDTAGTIGYATATVVVLAAGDAMCTVTTAADVDDGATSCAGPYGTDGKLSLPEAIRLVPAGGTITFSGPMTITGSGSYALGKNMRIAAPAGVILDTKTLSVSATVAISGLEITRQPVGSPIAVTGGGDLTLEDVYLHDSSGVSPQGNLTLSRTRVAACTADCVAVGSGKGKFPIVVRYSEFRDAPAFAGVALDSCSPSGKSNLDVYATVFARMGTGVRFDCNGSASVQNNTFVANATGVDFRSGGLTLINNIFTGQTATAVNCVSSNFNNPSHHLLYQNASDGCIGSDPNTIRADPLYIFPASSDYRLLPTSPAVNTALNVGLYLIPAVPAAPGPQFLGAGPDRGGRETF